MVVLHPLSDFIDCNTVVSNSSPSYYYEGRCPQSGELLRLPRTALAETIAHNLMQQLAKSDRYSIEGKMYGILLIELPNGEQRVLKAFSGLLNGDRVVESWVLPIPGRERVALEEAYTLAELDGIKQEIITLKQLPRQQYETLSREFERQLQAMSDRHRVGKQQRQKKRQILCELYTEEAIAIIEQLDEESRQQGIERRHLKRQQNEVLQPLKQAIVAADARIRELKQQRKAISQQLQAQMHAAYNLTNFSGQSRSLQQLIPEGMPTGTGDCCAPKLLHYAATRGLKPLAMAEFWWGTSSTDRVAGEFYGACVERCQPLMGFLLSGLSQRQRGGEGERGRRGEVRPLSSPSSRLPIIYEDEWLIAVNKPAGLLSVPGRYCNTFDSVLTRLRHLLPEGMALTSVHRLDLETSGILLLARDRQTHRQLSLQFQQRQVCKVYEAVLSGIVTSDRGAIELPLWGDPQNRPYQKVDERGKPSLTHFQVIAREKNCTRVEFLPLTGRTHQLRVHAADPRGLGIPILGDRLYGCLAVAHRLHLHARELDFKHPQSGETLYLRAKTPF